MTGEVLRPKVLILPKMTTAIRDTLNAEVGTIIYNTTTDKLNFCVNKGVGDANWEEITSA